MLYLSFLNGLKSLLVFINGLQHLINLIYHSSHIGAFFSLPRLFFFFFSFSGNFPLGGFGGPEKDRDSGTAIVLRLAIIFHPREFSIRGHLESSLDGSA